MAKPLLSSDTIFDEALRILAEQGAAGLTIRTLATQLRCSNSTLYQQVGSVEQLTRGVVAHAFSRLEIAFDDDAVWEIAVQSWCLALRGALLAQPELCKLMTVADRGVVIDYAERLLVVLERDGFSRARAIEIGGILAHVTLSMSLSDIAAPGEWDDPRVFATTVRWLIHGMALTRAEELLGGARSDPPATTR
ncbi:hypothetical protein ABZ319_04390 [Nocardia sp. NPDC005978]|uniref:TetR/AcrR family transcriptional regulator n=1 Tax=Nocardia sp. NPDC005978 TaxID=3156725 RepID=UPI0033A75C20